MKFGKLIISDIQRIFEEKQSLWPQHQGAFHVET